MCVRHDQQPTLRRITAPALKRDIFRRGWHYLYVPTFLLMNTFFGVYTRGGILATGAYDMALFTYANSPEPDDEYAVFHSSQIPDSIHPDLGNYGRVNDPIVDQSLQQGRDAVSFPARAAAYHRFLRRLAEQAYVIPLYTEVNIMVVAARVQNVLPHPDQVANTWNIADWWVSNTE